MLVQQGKSVEQSGEHRISAPRPLVWQALNDPEVLAQCIDGCRSMQQRSEGEFAAVVRAKVGPIRATFNATLRLADPRPPEGCTLHVEVKGGPAGFAKGSAQVSLQAQGEETLLRYRASAGVGGKLAQVGSRLIDGVASKMAGDFFQAFGERMASPAASGEIRVSA